MVIGRIIGWVFLAIGILCLIGAVAIFGLKATGTEVAGASSLGALWFKFHSGSLNLTQAIVQRFIWPYLWDPVLQTVLVMPLERGLLTVAMVTGAIGLALTRLFTRRETEEP